MPPRKVSTWRNDLPSPFNEPRPAPAGTASEWHASECRDAKADFSISPRGARLKRSNSTDGALQEADRIISWLRYLRKSREAIQLARCERALNKLRACDRSAQALQQSISPLSIRSENLKQSYSFSPSVHSLFEQPSAEEVAALAADCFPQLIDATTTITEYSQSAYHVQRYTLEEVLCSNRILGPPSTFVKVRWIHVDYHKLGTFWGSSVRFLQWGSDPILFEQSPIVLLQQRSAELDAAAGRSPLEEEELQGYKKIGRYYRQSPGSPEYLGLRVKPSWVKEEEYQLLIQYLEKHESERKTLMGRNDNDLVYGWSYLQARNLLLEQDYNRMKWLPNFAKMLVDEHVEFSGMWDDHVERLEFYREHTLFTCGSPRFYDIAAKRLQRANDPLRTYSDSAFLYYMLIRVSIENDEMMQNEPERDLNKIFKTLKDQQRKDEEHVRTFFGLPQKIIDGLEYLEENLRELPIWGVPPFDDHNTQFHYDFAPSLRLKELICEEMSLVSRDFDHILKHWRSLKFQVDRHLDLLIQFRVIEQQQLALHQSDLAVKQQIIAVEEAKTARAQAQSVSIFTFITVVFLPLSFFTSYFGIHLTDVDGNGLDSHVFWSISGPFSVIIILIAVFAVRRAGMRNKEPDDLESAGHMPTSRYREWAHQFSRTVPQMTKDKEI